MIYNITKINIFSINNYYLIYVNNNMIIFWNNFVKKYVSIKSEILKEANKNMKKLFGKSSNILGVKIRGTDYLSIRPKGHSISPKTEIVISDVKSMDQQYKYDFIFLSTEDEIN